MAHHGLMRSAQAQPTALRATAVVSVSLALSAGRLVFLEILLLVVPLLQALVDASSQVSA